LEENIVMFQELEIFRKTFRGNTKEEKKVHGCKGVKLWTQIITILQEVRPREQAQRLNTQKKTTLICLLYYNYSSNR
jgi:hypothetical protein